MFTNLHMIVCIFSFLEVDEIFEPKVSWMYIMCGFYNAKLNLEQLESLSRGVNVTIMTIRLTLLK